MYYDDLPRKGIKTVATQGGNPIKSRPDVPMYSVIEYHNGSVAMIAIRNISQHNMFIDQLVKEAELEGTAIHYVQPKDK